MADNVLFITNAFDTLSPKKDTSVFMMREFLERQYEVFQCLASDLTYSNGKMFAHCNQVSTDDNNLVLQNQWRSACRTFNSVLCAQILQLMKITSHVCTY